MVVVRVYGGLGNQMFQYAAALGVAARLGTAVAVDARWFRSVGPAAGREYGLDGFGIRPGLGIADRLRLLVHRPQVVHEDALDAPRGLAERRGQLVLDGYWQGYEYFAHCEARVREAFRVRASPPPAYADALRAVAEGEWVSLHVRRGDYTAPKRLARFGLMPPEYYAGAMAFVAERVREPRFLVFSDDLDWCRSHFAGDERVAFAPSATGAPAYEDLRLMTACAHHVVANSSFSWWGAWLGARPDAIVVAPERWFRDPALDATALVPPHWVRL